MSLETIKLSIICGINVGNNKGFSLSRRLVKALTTRIEVVQFKK